MKNKLIYIFIFQFNAIFSCCNFFTVCYKKLKFSFNKYCCKCKCPCCINDIFKKNIEDLTPEEFEELQKIFSSRDPRKTIEDQRAYDTMLYKAAEKAFIEAQKKSYE